MWSALVNQTGLSVLSTATDDNNKIPDELPPGVQSVGRVTRLEYEDLVAASKVMLGIGHPGISPSVYTAL